METMLTITVPNDRIGQYINSLCIPLLDRSRNQVGMSKTGGLQCYIDDAQGKWGSDTTSVEPRSQKHGIWSFSLPKCRQTPMEYPC